MDLNQHRKQNDEEIEEKKIKLLGYHSPSYKQPDSARKNQT